MQTTTRLDPNALYRIRNIARCKNGGPPLIDISASAWWQGVKEGRFPKPVRLGERMTCWRGSDLLALIERLSSPDEA